VKEVGRFWFWLRLTAFAIWGGFFALWILLAQRSKGEASPTSEFYLHAFFILILGRLGLFAMERFPESLPGSWGKVYGYLATTLMLLGFLGLTWAAWQKAQQGALGFSLLLLIAFAIIILLSHFLPHIEKRKWA
jgi:cation transport ATPase